MVWTFLHKNARVIKVSQPFFLQMIIVGILVYSSAIVPLAFDDKRFSQEASDIACMTVPWLLTIGFTTTVSEFQIHPYPPLSRCICKQNHLRFRLRPSSLPSLSKHGRLMSYFITPMLSNVSRSLRWTLSNPTSSSWALTS